MSLAWLDLETTGLSPDLDVILEIACIITDDALEPIATFSEVVYQPVAVEFADFTPQMLPALDMVTLSQSTGVRSRVIEMHVLNGLWRDSAQASPNAANYMDGALADFIRYHSVEPPQLAGSTISFDRSFLSAHMPKTLDALHYRNVDVSTLNEMARRAWPELHRDRPSGESAHRALSDVQASIRTYRYYVNTFEKWRRASEGGLS